MAVRTSARPFLPDRLSLKSLRDAAAQCEGCDLYKNATQTVFGEGPRDARLMLLGEMPGDNEDELGHPFVGPAGRLLDDALREAGIVREDVYLTNAVKHFRWEPRGKRRLHKKPSRQQIEACRPWLQAEVLVVTPHVILCLGATAAQTMLGSAFRLNRNRGTFYQRKESGWITATYHPSAVLRAPEKADRERKRAELVHDLRRARQLAKSRPRSRT